MVESYSRRSMIDHDAGSSQYTTTTDSTIPGPGALGGKAIKALGKFTIRGIDRVIISARLRSITSKFPHTNEQAMGIKNLQEMYNVILELCRTGMYNQELRMKAIQLLVGQIKQGHTQALITALSRWHLIEVELLLPELIDNIIPIRRQPWGRNRLSPADQLHVLPDLTVITHGAQSSLSLQRNIEDARDHDQALCTAYKLWFPQVFSFLSLVAGINPNTSKIVLQAGYLDLLLLAQKGNVPTKDLPYIFNVFLSRPQTFVPIVREKVINVILNDIIDGDIDQLIDALSKWPVIDLQALLMELETDQKLKSVLFKSSGSPSPFDRNIAFLFRVSQIRKSFVLAVLNAGFLDILKIAYDSKIVLDDNKLLSFVFDIIKVYHAVKEYQSKAIDLLISYIIDRKTTFILSTLKNWDIKDLEDLITTIFQRAGPVGFDAEGGPFGPGRYGFHSRDGLYHFDQTKVVSVMTFAGKVARFNEAAFQAVINAGILDALLVIQSHDLSIHGLDEPFNIILEVLRPGTYSNKIRKKALDLLVFQVCRGEARYMLKVLSDWNFNELNRIIVEISAQFPAMNNRRALEDLFKRPQETQALSTVYLQRLLSFLAGVARLNEPAGQAVLETGFMDVLLALQNDKAHKMEYDDVDELMLKIIQKPQLHEDKIKKKALTYISVQTEREETKMSKIIAKRNIWQLETLINGMLEHFNYGSNLIPQSPRQVGSPIKPNDLESLGTCVNIFSKVILKHRFAFQAMINAGILDLLLAIQERQCSIDGIKKIYDIVLTSVFLDSVNDKALRILSHQILTGQSTCLLSALQKHGDQEFHIIAPAILTGLKRALFVHEGHISPCPGPDKRSLMNCIDFLQKLSQSNSSLFCQMLDMGLVDLFLSIDKSGISARALISLYTVLFEYARPIMYPVEVNTRVLDFVTDKLATEKSFCLTKALEKVDSLILNEVVSHLFYRSKTLWSSCPPSFLGGQKLEQNWISFIKLMSAISRISPTACQSVLSHDFLDALYFMSQTKERLRNANKLHVKEAVISRATNSFLLDVIAYPEHRDTVFQHPVYPSVPTDTLQNIRKDELPLADWLSQIDFVLILVAAFAAVKSCKPLQYLYYTVLPCVTVCWSIIWMFILVRERPSAFDSIVTTMDM